MVGQNQLFEHLCKYYTSKNCLHSNVWLIENDVFCYLYFMANVTHTFSRTIGSTDIVTVDFNPRLKNERIIIVPSERCILMYQMRRHYVTFIDGVFPFRGLKSTVTTSSEPMALLNLRNIRYNSKKSTPSVSHWFSRKLTLTHVKIWLSRS